VSGYAERAVDRWERIPEHRRQHITGAVYAVLLVGVLAFAWWAPALFVRAAVAVAAVITAVLVGVFTVAGARTWLDKRADDREKREPGSAPVPNLTDDNALNIDPVYLSAARRRLSARWPKALADQGPIDRMQREELLAGKSALEAPPVLKSVERARRRGRLGKRGTR
jgi:hypothetical protein